MSFAPLGPHHFPGAFFLRGAKLLAKLEANLEGLNCVDNIRGKGMMVGIELVDDCPELVGKAMERGLLLNVTAGKVIRLLPPIILDDAQIDEVASTVSDIVKEWNAGR